MGAVLSDCLSLSSLGAQPSPAPKPVPLGDESGESSSLNVLPRLQGVKDGGSRALCIWPGIWALDLPRSRPLCSRKPEEWFWVRGEAQERPGEVAYIGQPPLGAALHLFSHLGPGEQMRAKNRWSWGLEKGQS